MKIYYRRKVLKFTNMNILKRLSPFLVLAAILMMGCEKDKYNFNDLPPTVKGFFTTSDIKFDVDVAIQFTNASEEAESYTWDFGDSTFSTETNPVKTYDSAGIYNVILRAVGPGGTGKYSMSITIIDPNANTGSDKELYFIEYGTTLIRKISLEPASTAETVVDMTGREAHGMAYDAVNGKIYYCDFESTNAGKIWRMDADGSNMEELLSGLASPYGIAINLAGGKMYIANGPNVSRANLDGTGYEKEFINVSGGAMRAVGYNSKTGTIYFYEVNDENLYSAKSDGTGVGKIIEGAYGYGIFVDEVNEKIYYDDRNKTAIMEANLDGSEPEKIANVTGSRGGSGIAIDYSENKLYWAETNNSFIKRINLDRTGAETFLSDVSNPRGMFIK